jgi:pyridinium-3,5-bisthiocarboxylic acid mononucleotide nickel chelatase
VELHLDLVGGLAGDMFIAGLLDAFPEHETAVLSAIECISEAHPVTCSLQPHADRVLSGRRFVVESFTKYIGHIPFAFPPSHEHTDWRSIRHRLQEAQVDEAVRCHAIAIFELLAQAEASVHGVAVDEVMFHEVGAWDSIADIVGAAVLIDALGAARWTTSAVPLGSGRVRTAHGLLAVPAPATTALLMGMATLDDGVAGERVTPTGAAILRYLCPPQLPNMEAAVARSQVRILRRSGNGFGSRVLPGLSNHVRVLCFDTAEAIEGGHREIDVLEFEVDDQSGEDLAAGLDRLRAHPAVLDVTQSPVFGKKGRMMVHVRALVRHGCMNEGIEACFRETTTIGLRHSRVRGIGLKRSIEEVMVDGLPLRVKIAERPGGRTAKTESDDVLTHSDHARRAALRARAERQALDGKQVEFGA